MAGSVYELVGQVVLTFLGAALAYLLGRATERKDYEKQKTDAVETAKELRDGLADPGVVRRLHDKYRR